MLLARLHVELLAVLVQRAQAGQVRLAQLHQLRALRAAEAHHAQDVRPLGAQLVALDPRHVRQVLAHQRQHLRHHFTLNANTCATTSYSTPTPAPPLHTDLRCSSRVYQAWLTISYIKDAHAASICLHGHRQLTEQVRTVRGCYRQHTSQFQHTAFQKNCWHIKIWHSRF